MAAEILTALGFQMDKAGLQALERGTKRMVTNVTQAAEGVVRINDGMTKALNVAKGIIAGYLTVRSFRMVTDDVAASVSELDKWNAAIGVSHQRLQEFGFAGSQTGLQLEDVGDAMKELAVKANDAFGIAKSKDAQELFKQMGIVKSQVVGLNGELKSTDELLLVVADAFSTMTNRAKAGAAIDDLLSDAGVRAAKLFQLGRKGIEKLAKDARDSGLIMDKRTMQAARLYAKQKRQIMALLLGFRNIIASKVLPPLTRFITRMREWWRDGDRAERITRNLMRAGAALAVVLGRLGVLWAVGKLKVFVGALIAAAAAMRQYGASAALAQIKSALIVGAITLLVIAVVDLYETMQGKETITTRLIGDPNKIGALRQALRGIARFLSEMWAQSRPVIVGFATEFGKAIMSLFRVLGPLVAEVGLAMLQIVTAVAPLYASLFKALVSVWAAVFKAIKPLIPTLATILRIWITIVTIPLRIMALKLTVVAKLLGGLIQVILALAKATSFIWKPALDAVFATLEFITRLLNRIAALIELAFTDPVEAARQAWEDLAEFFSAFWADFNDGAEDAVLWVIRAFKKIPGAIKGAFDAVVNGVKAAIMAIVRVVMRAVNALRAITGRKGTGGEFARPAEKIAGEAGAFAGGEREDIARRQRLMVALAGGTLTGPPIDRELSRGITRLPASAAPIDASQKITNNLQLGSVTVVANASDARQVGKTVEEVLDQRINKIVTNASRNMRKPKAGQK